MIRLLFLFSLIFTSLSQAATQGPAYYGRDFYTRNAVNAELKENLFRILSDFHSRVENDYDQIQGKCGGGYCYRHLAVGYSNARKFLFGEFYLVNRGGDYGVKDLYCDRIAYSTEFPGAKPGPGLVPDANIMNTEHTWPQSRFSRWFSAEDQKSDMHHLFPTDSQMNSKRGSLEFGNVSDESEELKCRQGKLGHTKGGSELVFEAPASHKGNVARAIFYFAIRYKMQVSRAQEAALKEWHRLDPVDEEEKNRNEKIFGMQKNRNPFIDFPELVEKISDF